MTPKTRTVTLESGLVFKIRPLTELEAFELSAVAPNEQLLGIFKKGVVGANTGDDYFRIEGEELHQVVCAIMALTCEVERERLSAPGGAARGS